MNGGGMQGLIEGNGEMDAEDEQIIEEEFK